ncbi:class I SAM-dependent methyltransferase [Tistlia consotensis]|uniref:class I SAM-dependent methyltransferase n=1 Tax=Tistlia consotensis TaxID=1321365 RepID=UPI0013563CC3|nr:methyltransferase domain-containing protein [Tistlia consotensis]
MRSIRGVRLVSARSGPAAELGRLEARLAAFYAADEGYFEFAESLDHSRFYEALRPHIEAAMTERRRLRVLEFGAGRSGFPDWLEAVGLRQRIELTAQDVTALNRDWLAARCEAVLLGDAAEGLAGGPYDLIFSTFVYEHLVRPDRVVEACVSALAPGGLLAIFSPAYVMPGYVPPALRARPRAQGLTVTLFLWLQALKVRLGGRPNFWVAAEPALFERGYFVDADAVHLVAPADLDRLLAGRAVRRPLRLPAQGLADWVWSRFLLLAALYEKR